MLIVKYNNFDLITAYYYIDLIYIHVRFMGDADKQSCNTYIVFMLKVDIACT